MLTLAAVVIGSLQFAQAASGADPFGAGGAPAPRLVGGEKYDGVVPGAATKNPLPAVKGSKQAHLIWSGFQMADRNSRVFFQTTGPVQFDVAPASRGKGGMSVFLRNCRIHLQNNRRHLDTRFFATPVSGVTAHQRHKDVELRIDLKEPATPTPRSEPGPDGTQFVVLEFPPGRPAPDQPAGGPSASVEPPSQQ